MMGIWNLLNDALCQEEESHRRKKDYYPDGRGFPPPPGGSEREWNSERIGPQSRGPPMRGYDPTMSEQDVDKGMNYRSSKGSRQGKGAPRDSRPTADGWSSTPPQQQKGGGKGGKGSADARSGKGGNSGPRQDARTRSPNSNERPEVQNSRTPRGSAQPRNGKGGGMKGSGKGARGTPGRNRSKSEDEPKDGRPQQDTLIGRGFTAAMKRGVAQAKPTPHEEMVPQKDGGFIATIQRGFEGLFGKPTSKEEVLRKRGPVIAPEYEAVPGDEIDQKVQYLARQLPEDVGGCVKIFRVAKGEYEINDERVQMEWKYRQNPNGQQESEIFVFWETADGDQTDPEPLYLYLSHAANVAYEVKEGGFVISQVPEHARLSFDEIGTKLTDGSADARFNAMEIAARQAQLREEAAVQWREKNNTDSRASGQQSPPISPRDGAPAPPPPAPQRGPPPPPGPPGPGAMYGSPGMPLQAAQAGIMPGQWVATGPTSSSMVVTGPTSTSMVFSSMSSGINPQGAYAGPSMGTFYGAPGGPLQRQATSMYSYGGGYGAAYAMPVQVR